MKINLVPPSMGGPWDVDDRLWELIEPLLLPWPDKAPGPRPVPDRLCLQGILFVLHSPPGVDTTAAAEPLDGDVDSQRHLGQQPQGLLGSRSVGASSGRGPGLVSTTMLGVPGPVVAEPVATASGDSR